MTADLIIRALKLTLTASNRRREVHSDCGGQYVDADFRALLKLHGCVQSMSRAGESYDNAHAASLFSRYKAELLEGGVFLDLAAAELETFEYIERYYNPTRLHSALGYTSPMQFERAYYLRAKTRSLNTKERKRS